MELDIESLRGGLGAFREAITSIKVLKDLLPESKDKEKLEQNIEIAEKSMSISDAKIAKALDYHLCQCTYPPQIMLSIGFKDGEEKFKCSLCSKVIPPEWKKPNVIGVSIPRR